MELPYLTPLTLIEQRLFPIDSGKDPVLRDLFKSIQQQYGDSLAAVLIYGSYTRGKRDTLLDFYVLLDHYRNMPHRWHGLACRVLPPNVYHIHIGQGSEAVYAKCAVLSLARFGRAMSRDFHSYFWARFAQPCGLLYCRDAAAKVKLADAFVAAAGTFVRRALPLMPAGFSATGLWREGLRRTYKCELRSENPQHIEALLDASGEYFEQITTALAQSGLAYDINAAEAGYHHSPARIARFLSSVSWGLRRIQGKFLSAARLLKAALTFDDALAYLLWKIERHSGINAVASKRQHRFPLLFAWPLLWRLYRQGAFR